MFFKRLYIFGDRFEDKVRARLSHVPLIYAALGGAGIILFWRGIWHTVDYLMMLFFTVHAEAGVPSGVDLPWWDGPLSILAGVILLLSIGLFVTSFIGDAIIISGLKSEKKLTEKTEEEILSELKETDRLRSEIHLIDKRMKRIEALLDTLADGHASSSIHRSKKRAARKETV